MKKIWISLLVILTLWGAYLRFENLGRQSFWMDEGFSVITATAIQEHGYPILDTGLTSWRAFPVHYIMSLGLTLFDDPQVGGRVFTALAGILLIPIFYFFNLLIFKSKRQAIIAAALMTFMTYEIAWSRQARMYVFLQLFVITSLYFYYRFIEEKKKLFPVLAIIFALLAIFTHQAGYLVALIIALTTFLDIKKFKPYVKWVKDNKFFAIGFLAVLGVLALALIYVKSDSSILNAFKNLKSDFGMNYSMDYIYFLFNQFGLFFILALVGFFILNWQRKYKYIVSISICAVLYFLVLSFNTKLFHLRYLLVILPFIFMYIAYAIDLIFEKLKKRHIAFSVIAGVLIIPMLFTSKFNFIPYYKYSLDRTAPQPDWKAGYEWVKKDAKKKDISTISILPMFHDIYIGKNKGDKYFIPYSVSGYPGDIQKRSPYSEAVTLETLSQFLETQGYVILDDYGYRMLDNDEIKNYLQALPPAKTFKNLGYDLMVWKL